MNQESEPDLNLGKKIIIVGVSATGKTMFAKELSEKLHLPVTFMDALMWKPGWNYIGDEETERKLYEVSLREEWIIEGYITKNARALVFDRADTIIYLDYLPIVASWRYVKRWWKHRKNARLELEGSPEKFSFKFMKLVWTKGEVASLNKFLTRVEKQNKLIRLASLRETKAFLQRM